MALPTVEDVDAAVPVSGEPSRALVNAVLKAILASADHMPTENSLVLRTELNGIYSAGRLKAMPAIDPDDCVTLFQTLVRAAEPPASSTSEGEIGDYYVGDDYLYICRVMNTWVRIPVEAW